MTEHGVRITSQTLEDSVFRQGVLLERLLEQSKQELGIKPGDEYEVELRVSREES